MQVDSSDTKLPEAAKGILVFLDLETSLSNPDDARLHILELAMIVINENAGTTHEFCAQLRPSGEMCTSKWAADKFRENGLWEDVRKHGIPAARAETLALAFLDACTGEEECLKMAGYNCGTFDYCVLKRLMPALAARFHPHVYDLSSARRILRALPPFSSDLWPRDACRHRALSDCKDALNLHLAITRVLANVICIAPSRIIIYETYRADPPAYDPPPHDEEAPPRDVAQQQ